MNMEAIDCSVDLRKAEVGNSIQNSVKEQFRPAASLVLDAAASTAASAKVQYLQPTADLILRTWTNFASSLRREEGDSLKVI